VQPALLVQHYSPFLLLTLIVIAGKQINCTLGALLTGSDPGTAFRAGLGMAQIGEFAYIIAAMGIFLGMTDQYLYQIAVSVSLLTTVINPYLLRGSDRLAAFFRPGFSPRFFAAIAAYDNWLQRIGRERRGNALARAVRRSIWVVLINAALICAIFLIGALVANQKAIYLPEFHLWPGAGMVLLWLGCALVALPLYVSCLRKIQALGMILSEICVPPALASNWAQRLRLLIAHTTLLLGILGLGLMTFVLSSTLLSSWYELLGLLAVLALVMWIRWRKLIGVYARAQSDLLDMFAREAPQSADVAWHGLLSVHMETVTVGAGSPSAGQRIGDLKLRTRTGANAVSIERAGQTLVNPGPGEMILPGDRILLLGRQEQIDQAIRLFS